MRLGLRLFKLTSTEERLFTKKDAGRLWLNALRAPRLTHGVRKACASTSYHSYGLVWTLAQTEQSLSDLTTRLSAVVLLVITVSPLHLSRAHGALSESQDKRSQDRYRIVLLRLQVVCTSVFLAVSSGNEWKQV